MLQVCNRMNFNSADPDKIPHIATFYVGFHCLSELGYHYYVLNYYYLYVLYTCFMLTFTEINYMSSGYGLTPFHLIHNSCSSHPKFT